MAHNETPGRWRCSTCCGNHQRPPARLCSTVMLRFSSRWCSLRTSVADVLLLGRCPPDMHFMFRSPASLPDRASACTCGAFARILRPIRAEMAENEAI